MLSACQLMVILLGTDFMTSLRCLFIFYYFNLIILFLRTSVCTDGMVLMLLFIYF